MTKTLFDLAKALLNATLILLALCLFLGWKLMGAVEGVTANAVAIADQVTPLRNAITGLQEEAAALRTAIETGTGTASAARLSELEGRLSQIQNSLSEMRSLPQRAAAEAARAGAAELAARLISATPGLTASEAACTASGS